MKRIYRRETRNTISFPELNPPPGFKTGIMEQFQHDDQGQSKRCKIKLGHCYVCGYPVDYANRSSGKQGGSKDGNGGNYVDSDGNPKVRAGVGCPACGAVNYIGVKT